MIEREREETFRCKLKRMAVGRTNSSQWKAIRPTIYRDLPPTTISIHMDKLIRNVALCTYDPHHNEGTSFREIDSTLSNNLEPVQRSNQSNQVKTLYTQALPGLLRLAKNSENGITTFISLNRSSNTFLLFFSLLFFPF